MINKYPIQQNSIVKGNILPEPLRVVLVQPLGNQWKVGKTDHYFLLTATPHKGDPQNFCLFLQLLDRDVYGDVKSLEDAMERNHAPFYLRRIKEITGYMLFLTVHLRLNFILSRTLPDLDGSQLCK